MTALKLTFAFIAAISVIFISSESKISTEIEESQIKNWRIKTQNLIENLPLSVLCSLMNALSLSVVLFQLAACWQSCVNTPPFVMHYVWAFVHCSKHEGFQYRVA